MSDQVKINIEEFPSNSSKQKQIVKNNVKFTKIIKGDVKTKKKRLGGIFFVDDIKSVGSYILNDIIVPAAKYLLSDIVHGAVDMSLFGEHRSRPSSRRDIGREPSRAHTSYDAYYRSSSDRPLRDISRKSRIKHEFDEIILDTRREAEEVLSHLVDRIMEFGLVSVGDLYDLVGIETSFADQKYGWFDLRKAYIEPVREGYLIVLPRTQLLD